MNNNKTYIKIESYQGDIPLKVMLQKICLLRVCEKIGDKEVVNNTQLGRLRDQNIGFTIINNK